MKAQLEQIKINALAALDAAANPAALEELRVKLLGKKGELTAVLKMMGKLSPEERPVMGQLANAVRAEIEAKLEDRKAAIHAAVLEAKLAAEAIDVTIPGETVTVGHQHPMNQVLQQIKDIFVGLGYEVIEGPEVELANYNFTRLNIEEGHPSRDRSDTFYFTDDDSILLRTQTSPMQVRYMETHKPPFCMLAPGRVFRKDEADATHSPMFHQIEGLVVDEHITMGDLKGALISMMRLIYGADSEMRFRPHHIPSPNPAVKWICSATSATEPVRSMARSVLPATARAGLSCWVQVWFTLRFCVTAVSILTNIPALHSAWVWSVWQWAV